ncbi:MAG: phosphohistidine phosphatase [Legionellales bacterium]|nr:phosphohistidine phosphatase [Legionellales bacterium]|tara:strand:- start:9949 stop:10437 length:489 start_codon:yes stop_codon:yes gene_type:complete
MKTLYLTRHAKSEHGLNYASDAERPLNERGKLAAPQMGQWLLEEGVQIDRIITSTAQRAVMTAYGIASALGYPESDIDQNPEIYNADVKILIKLINGLDNRYDNIMLVGHNPTFTLAANHLGDRTISHMPTCTICALQFEIDDWQTVDYGLATTLFCESPKR